MDELNFKVNKKAFSRLFWVFLYSIAFALAFQLTSDESIYTSLIWAVSFVLFTVFIIFPILNRLNNIKKKLENET